MRLTQIAEKLCTLIIDNKDLWLPTGLIVDVQPEIDWVSQVSKPGTRVLVIPELVQYNISGANSRKKVIRQESIKYLSILVGHTFDGIPSEDTVAEWSVVKNIIDIRENVESLIITTNFYDCELAVIDVESQPVDEVELQRRNFNAVTSIGFEVIECGLGQELSSMQVNSINASESHETKASMRRRLSSARKLGRA